MSALAVATADQATIDGIPVEAKLDELPDGETRQTYLRNGAARDPDDGRPAIVVYRDDRTVAYEKHCQSGVLQDPADGSPAFVTYGPDGTVEYAAHYQNGVWVPR